MINHTPTTPGQWQHWIFFLASIWLLFQMWRGWKLGLFRSILRFITILAAWFAGSATVVATKAALGFVWVHPPGILTTIIAAIVGAIVYLLFSFISRLLFRSEVQHRGLFGVFFGLLGAFCGLIFGAFFLWGGISIIRTLGMLEEAHFLSSQNLKVPQPEGQQFLAGKTPLPHLGSHLVTLKQALETGPAGEIIKKADPLSASFYDTVQKSIELLQSPAAMQRFINMPEVQEILSSPPIVEILQDPKVQQDISSGNIGALLSNAHVQAIFHNQDLRDEIKSFRLNEAMTRALHPQGQAMAKYFRRRRSHFYTPSVHDNSTVATNTPASYDAALEQEHIEAQRREKALEQAEQEQMQEQTVHEPTSPQAPAIAEPTTFSSEQNPPSNSEQTYPEALSQEYHPAD